MEGELKSALEIYQEEKKKQEEELRKIKERIQGRMVLLFGEPFVGKSLFVLTISKLFQNSTLLLIDRNYPEEFYKINPKLQIKKIYYQDNLIDAVEELKELPDQLIAIDSITSLSSMFLTRSLSSPRAVNEFVNFSDKILRKLSLFPATKIIVAHERLKSFETKEVEPRINKVVLRHCDVVMRMFVEPVFDNKGVKVGEKRTIKIVQERKLPTKVEWYFGSE